MHKLKSLKTIWSISPKTIPMTRNCKKSTTNRSVTLVFINTSCRERLSRVDLAALIRRVLLTNLRESLRSCTETPKLRRKAQPSISETEKRNRLKLGLCLGSRLNLWGNRKWIRKKSIQTKRSKNGRQNYRKRYRFLSSLIKTNMNANENTTLCLMEDKHTCFLWTCTIRILSTSSNQNQ